MNETLWGGGPGGGGHRASPWAGGPGSDGTYFLALKRGLGPNPLINPKVLFFMAVKRGLGRRYFFSGCETWLPGDLIKSRLVASASRP